jgi:hypothetical protein
MWKLYSRMDYTFQPCYSSPDITRMSKWRRLRWAGHAACMGAMRNAYNVLVVIPDGKRPFGRPRHKWKNIKMVLNKIGCQGLE